MRRKRSWETPEFKAEKNETFDFLLWLDELSDINLPNVTDDDQNRE